MEKNLLQRAAQGKKDALGARWSRDQAHLNMIIVFMNGTWPKQAREGSPAHS